MFPFEEVGRFVWCDESEDPFLLKLVCYRVDKLGDGRRSRRIVWGFSCEGKVDVRRGQRGCAAVVDPGAGSCGGDKCLPFCDGGVA